MGEMRQSIGKIIKPEHEFLHFEDASANILAFLVLTKPDLVIIQLSIIQAMATTDFITTLKNMTSAEVWIVSGALDDVAIQNMNLPWVDKALNTTDIINALREKELLRAQITQ
jgi:hypothetical protein